MGRKKGTPKTGGRKKGTPNKVTTTQREWLTRLIDNNRERIEQDINLLEPKDRLLILERLMQYSIPKLQAVQTRVELNTLTDEQIDNMITEITKGV